MTSWSRGPGRLSWLTVGRAQGKNSAPAAARLCGLDRAHQPRVAGPRCEAGGGRTEAGEAAPPPAPSHRRREHLGHWEKTSKPSCPQGLGDRVGGDPCAPLPGREEKTLPWGGRQRPGGQDPAGMPSRARGWGRGAKAEKIPTEPRHTGLDSSGWTGRTRPRPPDKPARVQANSSPGLGQEPRFRARPFQDASGHSSRQQGRSRNTVTALLAPGPTLPGCRGLTAGGSHPLTPFPTPTHGDGCPFLAYTLPQAPLCFHRQRLTFNKKL